MQSKMGWQGWGKAYTIFFYENWGKSERNNLGYYVRILRAYVPEM